MKSKVFYATVLNRLNLLNDRGFHPPDLIFENDRRGSLKTGEIGNSRSCRRSRIGGLRKGSRCAAVCRFASLFGTTT